MAQPPLLPHLLTQILLTLSSPSPTDPILACPASTRSLLSTRPACVIKLAHAKIHSYPFSKVPVCWLRLFTDASLGEAVRIVGRGIGLKIGPSANGIDGGLGDENGKDRGIVGLGRKRNNYDMSQDGVEGSWIQEVVRLLDMAVIMAGAPERGEMIEELLSALQDYVELQEPEGPVRKKCRRDEDTFPTEGGDVPEIRFPIPTPSALSMEAFKKQLETGQPLVMRDALTHWPALHERPWKSPKYLLGKTFGGKRLVPVEMGRSYTDDGWGQSIMTFKEFMDRYLLHHPSPASGEPGGKRGESVPIAYLAQHDLFSQIPSLRADISIPDYCYTNPPPPAPGTPLASKPAQPTLEEPLLNAWFGPVGTVSPLHTDPYHNILCQVVGKKYVRLYSPEESGRIYPRGVDAESGVDMSNTSEVDMEAVDGEKFPEFGKASFVECVLGEGECLYVPVGWWHFVKSLSVSFSVSFWWN